MDVPNTGRRYYQYIVVGCGGVGSAALYWLSRRAGIDVLGLEQFNLGHDHGGSQDHSRIIRLAYHDDRYTKLTPDTYRAWEEVEKESGVQLVYKTGGVTLARKDEMGYLIDKYVEAMDAHQIRYERLTGSQLHRRFPQFETDDKYSAIYEPTAGLVDAAMGNSVHVQLARAHGATVLDNCGVKKLDKMPDDTLNYLGSKKAEDIFTYSSVETFSLENSTANSDGAKVHTTKGVFQCRRLIVSAGAWINHVLDSIGVHVPVYVTQEQVTYFATPNVKDFTKDRYPIWIYHSPKYGFYGLPMHGNSGSKIGIDAGGPIVTPETRTYVPDPVREKTCIDHLKLTIPKSLGPKMYTKTCLYTMTPDRHFVVDTCDKQIPGWENVIVCCGAGHCFKFASLLGKILSEIAVDGRTQYDISEFNMDREAITDPNWTPTQFMGTGGKVPTKNSGQQTQSKL